MGEQNIEKLLDTAMRNIKAMVDVNTIVGDPVETVDGSIIIPISRVSFGFAAGGGDFPANSEKTDKNFRFAGGSGAGVMITPVAFLVVTRDEIRLLPAKYNAAVESLINIAPELIKQIKKIL